MATLTVVADKDSQIIIDGPNTNYGSDPSVYIAYLNTATAYNGIFRFDFSSLPEILGSITSAIVQIYYSDKGPNYSSTQAHYLSRCTRDDWTELGATWNKYDGVNNWSQPGGDWTATNEVSANVDTTPGEWISWDVTTLAQYALENVSKHLNVILHRKTGVLNNDGTVFLTRNYNTDTSLRPKLTITYTPAPTLDGNPLFFRGGAVIG